MSALAILRPLVADMIEFAARPTRAVAQLQWGRQMLLALALISVLDFSSAWLLGMLLTLFSATVHELPGYIGVDDTSLGSLLLLVAFAPLTEEPLFRGWLTGHLAGLRFGLISLVSTTIFYAWAGFWGAEGLLGPFLIWIAIVSGACIQWLFTRKSQTEIPSWFSGNFRWFVWISSLLFGLFHLGNFAPIRHAFDVFVILPMILAGMILAYARTRLGLWGAIALHSLYNFSVYLSMLVFGIA